MVYTIGEDKKVNNAYLWVVEFFPGERNGYKS